MHLTSFSDYSLRVLIYLATFPERLVQTAEISQAYRISQHHLVKVVNELGKMGYLDIKRGRLGGITLKKSPSEIKIGELVRATEPNFHMAECFNTQTNTCPITPACALKAALKEANDAFLKVLDGYTLEMMTNKGKREKLAHYFAASLDASA